MLLSKRHSRTRLNLSSCSLVKYMTSLMVERYLRSMRLGFEVLGTYSVCLEESEACLDNVRRMREEQE